MASLSLQSTYKLVSGYEIPVVGFGVSFDSWIDLRFLNSDRSRSYRFTKRAQSQLNLASRRGLADC